METPLQSSSSKVTVECTDPFGVFSQVKPLLDDQLPLRNLHWKSPSRPLRSIDSLHVNLVLASEAATEQKPSSENAPIAAPQRRHQIPGLRETPYLKILLLRCDDNETYKATARKTVKDWVKTNTPQTQSTSVLNSQENHDAFEWLIIHVVVPDTPAATQPRFARTNSSSDTSGERSSSASSSVWPNRASSTVLERLKADFNGSSKTAVDRVAQIRIPKPGGTGPRSQPVVPGLTPADVESQWEDVMGKLKSSILTSFDLRVGQYEEDIKEKDSQRNLPGWNFCTFFILKEGLARGFANVGLFEDALIGYDELAMGLDTVIREQALGTGADTGGTFFLGFSKDLQEKAVGALQSTAAEAKEENKKGDEEDPGQKISLELEPWAFPLDADKKPYRDLILSSNISVFDFRSYVFARQMILLLRAGNASALRDESKETEKSKKSEDLLTLADICRLTTEFISIGARTLRDDLENGLKEAGLADVDAAKKSTVIDNMVFSWTYCVTLQVLTLTSTKALTIPDASAKESKPVAEVSAAAAKLEEARARLAKKNSSLLKSPPVRPRPISAELFSSDSHSSFTKEKQASTVSLAQIAGAEDLASWRAELYLLARRVLQGLGKHRGWSLDWTSLGVLYEEANVDEADFEDVSLDDTKENDQTDEGSGNEADRKQDPGPVEPEATTNGIEPPSLERAAKSKAGFDVLYEALTDQAFRHYNAASRTKSAERAMSDLAVLKFRAGDYAAAASHFHRIAPFYRGTYWGALEGTMLELYGQCLKKLGQKEEYVQTLLKLLAKFAADNRTPSETRRSLPLVRSYLRDLFATSAEMGKDISAPLKDFFGGVEVEPTVHHYADKDGFQLQLSLRFLLDNSFSVDSIRIRLVGKEDTQGPEVWLEAPDSVPVQGTLTKVLVGSNATMYGWYNVDKIELKTGNIAFTYETSTQTQQFHPGIHGLTTTDSMQEEKGVEIFCYPAAKAFDGKILAPRHIDLTISRTIEIEMKSGWNHISKGMLRVRPATAGLRLRVTETELMDGDIEIQQNQETGNIEFSHFLPNSLARLRIPYSVENDPAVLSARLEVLYETDKGRFSYHSATSMNCTLPISVNVSDMFLEDSLFSKFTISPATMTPLRMLGCRVQESDSYAIESSLPEATVMDIFPKQPASIVYRFLQKDKPAPDAKPSKQPLALTIEFAALDEDALSAIERTFERDVQGSPAEGLLRFLVPRLLDAFRNDWSAGKLEVLGLLREVEMISYEAVRWDEVVGELHNLEQGKVREWLHRWHKNTPVIPLLDSLTPSISREIVIPVDIPSVNVVHTAELRLLLPDSPSVQSSTTHITPIAVGQMIAAELHLRHTRRWYEASKENTPVPSPESSETLEFSFEIHANPDIWLIGGKRRGNFIASESEDRIFPVVLLPQRPGHLLLPALDVKTFVAPTISSNTNNNSDIRSRASFHHHHSNIPHNYTDLSSPERSNDNNQHHHANNQTQNHISNPTTNIATATPSRRQIPCELDYRNVGDTLLVLPDLRRTTVSLDAAGGGGPGGAWLVDSERGGGSSGGGVVEV